VFLPMKSSAKKQHADNKPEAVEESGLVTAAKAVGSAAGKIAALVGAKGEAAPAPPTAAKPRKAGKLPKKNRHRLPRREKKAQAKAAERL
jgi:hypothetical protein